MISRAGEYLTLTKKELWRAILEYLNFFRLHVFYSGYRKLWNARNDAGVSRLLSTGFRKERHFERRHRRLQVSYMLLKQYLSVYILHRPITCFAYDKVNYGSIRVLNHFSRWVTFGTCVLKTLNHCKRTWKIWELWNMGLPAKRQFSKDDMACPENFAKSATVSWTITMMLSVVGAYACLNLD